MLYPHIAYKNDQLFVEEVDVTTLAEKIGTPFYCYSAAAMRGAYARLKKAINHPRVTMYYALKTNSNLAVIKLFKECGAGFALVSGGEFQRCLKAGADPKSIVYSGVGKTEAEIAFGLENGLGQFNVESIPEIDAIAAVAKRLGLRAPVMLRINPEVEAGGHEKITTGTEENKFGVNWKQAEEAYARMAAHPHLEALGITCHIGSQITEAQPFAAAAARVEEMVARLRAKGHAITRVSLGGGLGISYEGQDVEIEAYGKIAHDTAERLGCDLQLEPGRCLVGEAGILVSKVIYVKHGTAKDFLIVDAAMNDLIRPTLYEAHHPIVPLALKKDAPEGVYDVVGPICESGDYLALDRQLPACHAGDFIGILCAGAYGASMASTYNSRALCPEVLVSGVQFAVIRARLTLEQQLAWETMPDWA